jgi:hypothetical protein
MVHLLLIKPPLVLAPNSMRMLRQTPHRDFLQTMLRRHIHHLSVHLTALSHVALRSMPHLQDTIRRTLGHPMPIRRPHTPMLMATLLPSSQVDITLLRIRQTSTSISTAKALILVPQLSLMPQTAQPRILDFKTATNTPILPLPTMAPPHPSCSRRPRRLLRTTSLALRPPRGMSPRIARSLRHLQDQLLWLKGHLRFSSKFRATFRFIHGYSSIHLLSFRRHIHYIISAVK